MHVIMSSLSITLVDRPSDPSFSHLFTHSFQAEVKTFVISPRQQREAKASVRWPPKSSASKLTQSKYHYLVSPASRKSGPSPLYFLLFIYIQTVIISKNRNNHSSSQMMMMVICDDVMMMDDGASWAFKQLYLLIVSYDQKHILATSHHLIHIA